MSNIPQRHGVVAPEAFARTYDPRTVGDPWILVEQYHAVLEIMGNDSEAGTREIAEQLDLPEDRVHAWVGGEEPRPPACARGLEDARAKGWIDIDPGTDTFRGLNVLVASIFSGGSISRETWVPTFPIDGKDGLQRIVSAFHTIGAGHPQHQRDVPTGESTVSPTESGEALGRVLCVLGAPVADNHDRVRELPTYLQAVDGRHRKEFARTYVANRGQYDEENGVVTIDERESYPYLDQLAQLFEDSLGTSVTVNDRHIEMDESAAYAVM